MRPGEKLVLIIFLLGLCEKLSAASLSHETQLRVLTYYAMNPKDETFYEAETESGAQFFLRESGILKFRRYFKIEANAFAFFNYTSAGDTLTSLLLNSTDETHRSSYLQRHWYNEDYIDSHIVTDRFALNYAYKRIKVAVGRFPINLSNLTIFRPNDLFAPFRGQSLYRKYKSGVDAAEAEIAVRQLSRINFYAVRGYKSEAAIGGSDKQNQFSYEDSAALARGSTTFRDWNFAVLGGKFGMYDFYGGSFQGEVGELFEINFEGHHKSHRRLELSNTLFNLGIAKRFGENLLANFEYFNNGAGYTKVEDYGNIFSDVDPPKNYLGRDYVGANLAYDFTPLTKFAEVFLLNITDMSILSVSSLSYSTTENSDINLTVYLPVGATPKDGEFESEYGTYPLSAQIDFAAYW